MAFIGLRHPVFAPISAETAGSAITYGTGMVIGHAISANLTKTLNTNGLDGDDVQIESDNSEVSYSVELGVDDLLDTVRAALLGEEYTAATTGTNATPATLEETDEGSPYVGFGYIRVRQKNGDRQYQAVWCHKIQFGETSENATTKKSSGIEWQTPTITGTGMGVYIDNSGKARFRKKATFATEAEAIDWLDDLAGIQ